MPMLSPSMLIPVQFLSAGNLVSAGLQLYLKHLKPFLRLSFAAHSWVVLPLVLLFGSGLLLADAGNLARLLVLLVPASLLLFVYGLAKYLGLSAAMSRLAYSELLQTPETLQTTSRFVNSRIWGFLLIGFLIFLIYLTVTIGVYLMLVIGGLVVFAVAGAVGFEGAAGSAPWTGVTLAGLGLILLIVGIPALLLTLWLTARFLLTEVTFAVEPDTLAGGALPRSWVLTRQNGGRVVVLLLVILTVLFPLQLLTQLLSTLLQAATLTIASDRFSGAYVLALAASYVLAFLLSVLTLPVWQATKAVLYYDLRSRREGLGLQLELDRPNQSADRPAPPILHLFRRVQLVTPESVELEFVLAGIGNRALAALIDYGLLVTGGLLFWVVLGLFSSQLLRYLGQTALGSSDLDLWLVAIGLLINFIVTTGYFIGFEVLRQGQTPGKRWTNIRVIRDDGRPVGLAQAVLRSLLQPIDLFLFIGTFMIIRGRREKRIGDWVAGTLVIQEHRVGQAIVLSDAAQDLSPHLPAMTHLRQLQPHHFSVISEYLQRRTWMDDNAKKHLSLDLARQVRTVIQLETIPAGLTSDQFLEAVYLAYQAQF